MRSLGLLGGLLSGLLSALPGGLLGALLGAPAAPSLGASAPGLAIVGATAIDGRGGPPITDAIVVVEGERIKAVGPRSLVPVPKGVALLDGRGRWLIPGLVDAHVHFSQSGGIYTRPDIIDLTKQRPYAEEIARLRERLPLTLARYVLCGITSVADVGGPLWTFEVRERSAATLFAPRVAVAGPLISTVARPQLDLGDPPIVKVSGAAEARALVGKLVPRDPDLVKIWFIFRPGDDLEAGRAMVTATVDESHVHGLRVAVHATELETAQVAVEAGASVLVHSVQDKPVDEAFVALLKRKDVTYTPTLFVREGYDLALSGRWTPTEAERRFGDPEVLATLEEIKTLPGALRPSRNPSRESPAPDNLRRVAQAGVTIAAGTDAGNIGTLHGPSMFRELRLMVEAGMTPAQVLTAATRGGARVMGREKDLGTIETGKLADLVLLDGDPLADLGNLERIARVVKGGRDLDPRALLHAAGLGPSKRADLPPSKATTLTAAR